MLLVLAMVMTGRTDQAPHGPGGRWPTDRRTPAEATWRDIAYVWLPFSRRDGPRITAHGQAGGYSHSVQGAALAAVQELARASETSGPAIWQPLLATQVVGPDNDVAVMPTTLARQYEQARARVPGVADGDPVPTDGQIAGDIPTRYEGPVGTATVEVMLTSPDLRASSRCKHDHADTLI